MHKLVLLGIRKGDSFDRGNTMPDGRLLACFLLERVTYDKGTQKLGVGEHT